MKGIPSIQVIMAALNEEEGIGRTIAEFRAKLGISRVLVVDGRSTDRTAEIAENLGAEVVFQEGSGKGDALAKAPEYSDLTVDYVITGADHTYPAEYIPLMIRILKENPDMGMVSGNQHAQFFIVLLADLIACHC